MLIRSIDYVALIKFQFLLGRTGASVRNTLYMMHKVFSHSPLNVVGS